jgi:hypothetical protein
MSFPTWLFMHPFFNFLYSLVPLVKKVHEDRILDMVNKLCDKLLNGRDPNRDIASIAMKTIIAEVPTSLAEKIPISLSPQLINGVISSVSVLLNILFYYFWYYIFIYINSLLGRSRT